MNEPAPLLLVVILGPTGTGKSEIACRCAERFGGEVIGFDSMQVYRGLDAATAKPTVAMRRRVPHHGIDIADPDRDFSLGDFVRMAEAAVEGIRRRDAIPVLTGGTGLYLQGFLHGIMELPRRLGALRDRLHRSAERRGGAHLHRLLRRLDPGSAARIGPGDRQRVVRALEIRLETGVAWSEHLRASGSDRERFATVKIGLTIDRDRLYRRLDRRVEAFFSGGLVEEVRGLLGRGVPPGANAFKAICYREALRLVRDGGNRAEAVRDAQRSTRQYAKRQWTWFRRTAGVRWIAVDGGLDAAWKEISACLADTLAAGRDSRRS